MNSYAIAEVIAHRPPMVLLSRLISYNHQSAVCEVDISELSPFYQSSLAGVANYVGIEYMAQTIAAFAGAQALDAGKKIEVGFLLGSRKYQTEIPKFEINCTYKIVVEELYKEDSGLSVFQCQIFDKDKVIAEAKINAFQPQNAEQFLKEQ